MVLCLLVCWLAAWAWGPASAQTKGTKSSAGQEELLSRIWQGVQDAQNKTATACGNITETRTSKIFLKPKVFHGKFCAQGAEKFALEYLDPEPVRLRFNTDYLNVTTGGADGLRTEAIEVGRYVRRAQSYFSRDNSIRNLLENFTIRVRESDAVYEMRLEPRTQRFASRINSLVVRFDKIGFSLRALEVDGTSGVRSVFSIEITSKNTKLDDGIFSVYKP
jgi:hypothetical protein